MPTQNIQYNRFHLIYITVLGILLNCIRNVWLKNAMFQTDEEAAESTVIDCIRTKRGMADKGMARGRRVWTSLFCVTRHRCEKLSGKLKQYE